METTNVLAFTQTFVKYSRKCKRLGNAALGPQVPEKLGFTSTSDIYD